MFRGMQIFTGILTVQLRIPYRHTLFFPGLWSAGEFLSLSAFSQFCLKSPALTTILNKHSHFLRKIFLTDSEHTRRISIS